MTVARRTRAATGPSRRETGAWYAIAFVTYVGAALSQKALLNWVLGPAWVVAVVTGGPVLWRRTRRG